jgi:hypothetical protein
MPASAHDLGKTSAALLLREEGAFVVDLTADLDALLVGAGPGHDSAELASAIAAWPEAERAERIERLEELFERRIRIRFDGQAAAFGVSFPDRRPDAVVREGESPAPWLGQRVRLAGRVPEAWREVTFWGSRAFQAVRLTVVESGTGRQTSHELEAGEESPPFSRLPADG